MRAHRLADAEPVLPTTVAGILRAAAVVAAGATGLVEGVTGASPGRRWTYAEMLAEAERAAGALVSRLAPGERLAVYAPSIPESLLLTYAAAMAELVLVPVNPALRSSELAHVLGQSGAAGVFLVPEFRGQDLVATLSAVRLGLPALREVVDFGQWEEFCASAPSGASPPSGDPGPDDVAQIIYTSGTTGAPKGALLTHRGLTNAARLGALRFGMRAGDVYVHTMPLFHVGGQVVSFQICQQQATAVLLPAFDAGLVLELVEAERATLTCGVPTMFLAMTEHPDFSRRDLSSLRAVSSGGAVVPVDLVRHIEATLDVRFAIVFGQTEACGFISQTELDDADEDKAATLGRPLPAVEVRVVDDEGAVVATGDVGELEIRGPNVMAGYHDLPDDTAQALAPDGWLRTGDLVSMDDRGVLRMMGRRKDMIVRGGENIFPAEIEEVLRLHADVAQVAVVGVPDRRWGEVPVAVVRRAPGTRPSAADLEAFLRPRLAPFKVPRRWVVVDDLPLTASGKVQKFVLRRLLAAAGDRGTAPGPDAEPGPA
ncbi:MAG: class I adenylate-forming enzyme family protein [Acidimicrobiales bacterium]